MRKKSVGARTENEAQRQLGLKHAWTQKWFVQFFGSGLICPRAQTCMDSKVVRADFWQRIDLPPGSNMLRLAYADSGSACKLAGVQIIPLPTLANQILARTFFRSVRCPRERIKFSLERFSDLLRIRLRVQPLESSLGRVPQAADGTCK